MYVVVWEFQAKPGREKEFELAYGPQGVWAQLFEQAEDFLGTELQSLPKGRRRYLTIDRWTSQAAHETFLRDHRPEYDEIDQQCGELTEQERPLGNFTAGDDNG